MKNPSCPVDMGPRWAYRRGQEDYHMTNRREARFYAIDCEDGPQFYMLVRGPQAVSCFLCLAKDEDELRTGSPTLTLSAYDAATVMWVGRELSVSASVTVEG